MAKEIDRIPSKVKSRTTRQGQSKYPFDKWLTPGKIWWLKQGEDFDCKLMSMRRYLRDQALPRGVRVKTYTDAANGAIYFEVFKA